MMLIPYSNIWSYPKVLSPHSGHGQLANLRYPGNDRFFWVDERVFPTVVDWRTNAPKDGMPAESTYSIEAVRALDTHRTPIKKQPEMLPCLIGLSRRYYLGDEVYPTFLHDDDRDMDLFNLIHAPNPTKVKTGSRPCAPHEVPLLTLTATRVIELDDPAAATDSSGVPSTIERSPLDFAHKAGVSDQGTVSPEMPPSKDVPPTDAPGVVQAEEVSATDPAAATESRKRGRNETDVNAPPKSLRRNPADPRPTESSHGEKSLAAIQLGLSSTVFVPESTPAGVSDPDPLSFADPPSRHPADIAQSSQGTAAAGDPDSKNASSPVEIGSPESYFSELRHMHNDEFLRQYNVNLARQVAMGSQLRLRFEQEAKLLRKSVAQVAILQEQVCGEEKLKAAFEEFKRREEDRVEQRCAELDARLDALSIDFDEELYPHMLTAIAGRRWVIGHGLRLAVIKCGKSLDKRHVFADVVSAGIAKSMSEGLMHGVKHGQAQLNVESVEAYNPEAEAKFVVALQALKDLKYPLVDQLEGLKDAPMDAIMAALYLKSDTGDDASQYIRDLRPSSSQLIIPVYPEVRDPRNPWAYKEEILLADTIAENISRAEKKKNAAYYAVLTGLTLHTTPVLMCPGIRAYRGPPGSCPFVSGRGHTD
nr:transposase (putative), gypsy type [Tanacetum cinerariifolium]